MDSLLEYPKAFVLSFANILLPYYANHSIDGYSIQSLDMAMKM